MGNHDRHATSLTKSVTRALSILCAFSESKPQWRVNELADHLGVTQSTVSRLLSTLEPLGFVQRDPETGLYGLGLSLVTLAGVVLNQSSVRRAAVMELTRMSHQTGLGANLAIRQGLRIFYLAHVDTPQVPRTYTLIGRTASLHATALGKALLLDLESEEVAALLREAGMPAFTPKTRTDINAFLEELQVARSRGYTMEQEEQALSRACIAAPVRGASGQIVAAISLSGPLSVLDLDRRLDELASICMEAADRISMNLGYEPGQFSSFVRQGGNHRHSGFG